MVNSIGQVGVWRSYEDADPALAQELERLGYGTLWLGASPPAELAEVERVLAATERLVVATGIVNIWATDPADVAASYHRIVAAYPGRFLLGVGIGHPEATREYRRPYATIVDYLDRLDEAGVPRSDVALAALGPKVMRLAGERTAGAHPYLTVPEHTREARQILGPEPLLVPEQMVVLDSDPVAARATARPTVAFYLRLRNYTTNLRRSGFSDEDLAGEGSGRLIDALAPHGDAAAVAAALTAHLDAGANQVILQLLTPDGADPLPGYRTIANHLGLTTP